MGGPQASAISPNQQQTNETMVKVQSGLSNYWAHLVTVLKNPTKAYQLTDKQMTYGLVTMFLYALTFSLSIYFLANSFYKSLGGLFGAPESLPFFGLNARFIFGVIIVLAIAIGSMIAMMKIIKHTDNVKVILSQYSGFIVPFLALNLVAIIGGLASSPTFTMIPLLLSNLFVVVIIPVIYVYEKSASMNPNGHKVYHSFATVGLILIATYILSNMVLSKLFDEIEQFISFL